MAHKSSYISSIFLLSTFLLLLISSPTFAQSDEMKCISGDCESGEGVAEFLNGTLYEGEFYNSLPSQGVATFADGSSYEGTFMNGNFHGHGFYSSDAEMYEGDYRFGKRSGKGLYADSVGFRYGGQFSDDVPMGYGILIYPSNFRFEGYVSNGNPINGVTYSPAGTHYYGSYKNGSLSGKGIFTNDQGELILQEYENGELINEQPIDEKLSKVSSEDRKSYFQNINNQMNAIFAVYHSGSFHRDRDWKLHTRYKEDFPVNWEFNTFNSSYTIPVKKTEIRLHPANQEKIQLICSDGTDCINKKVGMSATPQKELTFNFTDKDAPIPAIMDLFSKVRRFAIVME